MANLSCNNAILVIGESGAGKSTSLRNLDPKETCIVNVVGKPLPFKGWKSKYTIVNEENKEGNMVVSSSPEIIIKALRYFSKRENVKYIIIDDFQYLMSLEFMKRCKEKGYDKFNEIGFNAFSVIRETIEIGTANPEKLICVMAHVDRESDGREKIKTIGRMLDDKVTIEGLYSVVLYSVRNDDGFFFMTNGTSKDTCKSPMGMFQSKYIDNDLALVAEAIKNYEI